MTRHVAEKYDRFTLRQAFPNLIHYYSLRELPRTLRAGLVPATMLTLTFVAATACIISLLALYILSFPSAEIAATVAQALTNLSHPHLITLVNETRTVVLQFLSDILGCFVLGCILSGGPLRFEADSRAGTLPVVITDANAAP